MEKIERDTYRIDKLFKSHLKKSNTISYSRKNSNLAGSVSDRSSSDMNYDSSVSFKTNSSSSTSNADANSDKNELRKTEKFFDVKKMSPRNKYNVYDLAAFANTKEHNVLLTKEDLLKSKLNKGIPILPDAYFTSNKKTVDSLKLEKSHLNSKIENKRPSLTSLIEKSMSSLNGSVVDRQLKENDNMENFDSRLKLTRILNKPTSKVHSVNNKLYLDIFIPS